MAYTLAFDIGGTKIAYGAVSDKYPEEVVCTGTIAAQPEGSTLAAEFDRSVGLALAAAREAGIEPHRVGIGAPGIVREGAILRSGPTAPGWQGTVLADLVGKHTDAPIASGNDVRIWAYGEHHFGIGRKLAGRVFYISLGTGVGGAIVEDGQLMGGSTGSAGEFSELLVADLRGHADRAESVCSGTGLARYYNVLAADPDFTGIIAWDRPAKEGDLDLYAIMERYHAGEELARNVVDGNLRGLGRALAGLAFGFDLDAVVIGGGVAGIGDPVFAAVREAFSAGAVDTHKDIPIVPSALGGMAPLVGAAAYARDKA
ncbi:hypothetical protein CPHO_04325 [Corynebacterium phocae]|uniref:Glucokinase n=1 Tax=Corynebacterium phocae TaxID=161895 RepID=A0A1L7D272_9CORY|nr:ROK family protein [Corynebacterium phocae]APT92245.1 hypothetical protein CPHO_04325 [Corynebacterium phocae]KAA8725386.1 ROK family protein [Corynebacterium phocae]